MSLKLENVTYTYSPDSPYEMPALKGVDLELEQGEFVGLIGHTGSGKSTLIRHMNGLVRPDAGKVLFRGEDIWEKGYDLRSLRFRVGLVFQYPEHQLFEEDVLRDVCFGPKNMGLSAEECEERAVNALSQVGLSEEYYRKSPFELSGGQKRRAAIAGVLAMDPEFLILDEPTAGLDPGGRDEILGLAASLHRERGITVVLVSHSMEDIAEYVSRLVVLDRGRKAFDASPREVFSHHEELEAMGLSAPRMTYILQKLKARGMRVNPSAITLSEARDSILAALKRES